MKIIFMGTPEFAVPSLKILLDNKYDLQAVVTVPDKKKGRGLKTSFSDVKNFALEKNLKVLQPDNLKDEKFINEIKTLAPELIIVVAFRILPKEVYTIPEYGSINLHGSLLPKYRGAAPINRSIINGDSETGVTTFFLKDKVDTGNIILQNKIRIEPNDNAGSIHDKLSVLGADLVLKTVRLIEKGNIIEFSQDESLASPAPKIFKQDCKIDWNKSSTEIHNFIRGLSPYPAAYTLMDNKTVKIFKSTLTDMKSENEPGSVIVNNKKLFVCTKDKLIEIHELQLEGKKRISAVDFINGLVKN
ncbi:MAG: methionyl-tRNA formyltransferase [Ignavibacteriae bacterium]|nr:methionyl-tRNA formyltransferase [Ignavibacteriota bacterium]